MITTHNIGLLIIALAWVYQYTRMRYGRCTLRTSFAATYAFGTGLLVISGWNISALTFAEGMNILAFIAAIGVTLASRSR